MGVMVTSVCGWKISNYCRSSCCGGLTCFARAVTADRLRTSCWWHQRSPLSGPSITSSTCTVRNKTILLWLVGGVSESWLQVHWRLCLLSSSCLLQMSVVHLIWVEIPLMSRSQQFTYECTRITKNIVEAPLWLHSWAQTQTNKKSLCNCLID